MAINTFINDQGVELTLIARIRTWKPQPIYAQVVFNDGNDYLIYQEDRQAEIDYIRENGGLAIDEDLLNIC